MFIGFVIAGASVSYYALKYKEENDIKKSFVIIYGLLIWCAFDLTMIPLGFGLIPTILFIITSMIAFLTIELLSRFLRISSMKI